MYAGAAERAAELGCRLEEFDLRARGMSPARLREILHTRHIHAVVVAPLPHRETRMDFDFSALAVVGLGMSVQSPLIERITNDHFQSATLAVAHCVALGYRRIGFVVSRETSHRLDHRWLGGYYFAVELHRLEARVPPLMTDWTDGLPAALPGWLRHYRPDVVILGNSEVDLFKLIPASVGLVDLSVERRDGRRTGIFQNYPQQGAIAVEHAVTKLQTNTLGPMGEAQLHLVAGSWVTGATAPGVGRRRSGLL
jgi:LacI family transcriptional regulator